MKRNVASKYDSDLQHPHQVQLNNQVVILFSGNLWGKLDSFIISLFIALHITNYSAKYFKYLNFSLPISFLGVEGYGS